MNKHRKLLASLLAASMVTTLMPAAAFAADSDAAATEPIEFVEEYVDEYANETAETDDSAETDESLELANDEILAETDELPLAEFDSNDSENAAATSLSIPETIDLADYTSDDGVDVDEAVDATADATADEATVESFDTEEASAADVDDTTMTIHFNANGGTFEDGTTDYEMNFQKDDLIYWSKLDKEKCVRANKYFMGWSTSANATWPDALYGKDYEDLSCAERTYHVSSDATLYAVWADEVTVTYVANGGWFSDGSEELQDQVPVGFTPNTSWISNPQNTSDWKFIGWAKTNDASLVDYSFEVNANITLYAVWTNPTPITFTIYNETQQVEEGSLNSYDDPTDSVTLTASVPDATSDFTYQWYEKAYNASEYTAIANANSASYTMSSIPVQTQISCVVKDPTTGRSGTWYALFGQNSPLKIKGSAKQQADGSLILTAAVTDPTGQTQSSEYTYSWNYQTLDGETYSFVEYNSNTGLDEPTIEFTQLDESGASICVTDASNIDMFDVNVNSPYMDTKNQWIINPQNTNLITFDANGGTCSDGETEYILQFEKGEQHDIGSEYSYEVFNGDKICIGWSEDPNSTVPDAISTPDQFSDEEPTRYTLHGSATLYAVWADPVTITLDAGDGYMEVYTEDDSDVPQHVQSRTITVAEGYHAPVSVNVTNNDPNYEFVCWETDDHTQIENGSIIKVTKSETFHAVYQHRRLIQLNAGLHGNIVDMDGMLCDGWSGYLAGIDVVSDLQLAIGYVKRNTGYLFLGWAKDPESTTALDADLPLEDGVVYYAIYKKCIHSWDAGVITTKATCTRNGVKTYGCDICGQEKTTTIKATGHKYGSYKTTKAATALAAGSKYRICSVCKHKQTVAIPKLTPICKLNVTSLLMQQKQVCKTVKVTMQKGDYVVAWKSSNTNVLKVTGGVGYTDGKAGTCVLTAQARNGSAYLGVTLKSGLKQVIKVTVQAGKVPTTYMKLTAPVPPTSKPTVASLSLAKGKYYPIKVKRAPLTANEKITYVSNNKAVATVTTTGVIKAIKAGSAVITVTSGTKKVYVKVTVK